MIGRHGKARTKITLGPLAFSVDGGKSKTLSRPIAASKRRRLNELTGLRLEVKLDVTDAAGNRSRGRSLIALAG